ncbi:MAG: anaerobic glycerol-3-phosphate dehydrogenase subunit GlpA [Thermincolia bacterium]
MERTQVVVLGGGATGTGILRDLAMRGIEVILLEQLDLAHGTSSRFHGLLHSGARYAVNDPESAKTCIAENRVIRKIGKCCVEDIEGLFVQLPQDDPAYVEEWVEACMAADIPVQEISIQEALALEPNLHPQIVRAFKVPDGAIDGFRLVWANVKSAEGYGAKAYTYHRVDDILVDKGRVLGVEVTDLKRNQKRQIKCDYVLNATGAWVAKLAALAGVKVEIVADKGTLLALNHRITDRVINRLRHPGDGDIVVPHGTVSILGTTSVKVNDPECLTSTREEVLKLLQLGQEMFPGIEEFRILRAFAGVRPLYKASCQETVGNDDGRGVSREFALIDHEQDGVKGLISIVGGKLTTYRLMAEKTVDYLAGKIGNSKPCRTGEEELLPEAAPAQIAGLQRYLSVLASSKAVERLGAEVDKVTAIIAAAPWKKQMICECEQVSLAEIELNAVAGANLNDIRRKTRMGMGTCQGMVCTSRAIGQLYESGHLDLEQVQNLLEDFLEERWKGNRLILWGDQARQAELARNRYLNLFNINEGVEEYEI